MSSKVSTLRIQALHVKRAVTFECASLSIKQEFNPNWNAEPAYGKMDDIAIYSNTTRTLALSFTCLGKQEKTAISLKRDVESFIQMQYPLYGGTDPGKTLLAPPFFNIRSLNGKIYNDFEGYITSFDVTPGSNNGVVPLVTRANTFVERRYDISIGMTVMHSEQPGFIDQENFSNGKNFYFSSPGDQPNNPSAKPLDPRALLSAGIATAESTVGAITRSVTKVASTITDALTQD